MTPPRRLRLNEPLELGQSTIFSALNGSLAVARPPPRPRRGLKLKTTGHANTVRGRRVIGGTNEKQNIELFANARLRQVDNAEPGDEDIVKGVIEEEELDDDDGEYLPKHRYSYTREHKLATVDYFQTTWREKKDGTYERLSSRYTAR
jgi:hypothetical protein